MMLKHNFLIFIIFVIANNFVSYGQTKQEKAKIASTYDQEKINLLNTYFADTFEKQNKRLVKLKALYNWPDTLVTKDGSIASLITVNYLDVPMYVSTMNDEAAQMQNARSLQTGGLLGLNIEGQGMIVGVWDGDKVRDTHNAFSGRIIPGEFLTVLDGHATHVAGTIASNGIGDLNARGIAPQASIKSYRFRQTQMQGADEIEMAFEAANGMLVSNHSYGIPADAVPVALLGKYDNRAQEWDLLAQNYPYYLIVTSAGNSRNLGANLPDGGFDLLTSNANAKNVLTVGATNGVANYAGPSSVANARFSSYGPTDDGRVKPDISTKGVDMYSTDYSGDSQYINKSGTSMSSPAVAGGAILLQQYYNNVHSNFMKAATLKGVMLHTVDEAGASNGPDYSFGWGLLNTEKAAIAIANLTNASSIAELNLSEGATYSKTVTATGNSAFGDVLTISISWTDPATLRQHLPSSSEDDRAAMIENDLDLIVTSSAGVIYRPWKLDPVNPTIAATTGVNDVDNFEKIEIDQLTGDFTINVTHKGSLIGAAQDYTLVITGANSGTLSSNSEETSKFTMYPNPTKDQFTLALKEQLSGHKISISVYDILGKQIINTSFENTGRFEENIEVSSFKPGIYLVRVGDGSTFSTRKLIIR
jgi:serine protease AprX